MDLKTMISEPDHPLVIASSMVKKRQQANNLILLLFQ